MNKIYEAHSGTSPEMRTHLGCISAWSNQGLIAYTCERIIENKPFMELHIFNSQIPWDEFSVPLRAELKIYRSFDQSIFRFSTKILIFDQNF